MAQVLSTKRKQILDCISEAVRERGYPPSVREIGEAVGLTSSSTVHAHLAVLQTEGYLRRDPTKPRAIEVCYDPSSKVIMDARPIRHVPLVGDVAAGTGVLAQENVEELYPLPEDFTGTGTLFMRQGAGRLDDRRRHHRRRLRRRAPAARCRDRATSWWPASPTSEATVKRFSTQGRQGRADPRQPAALAHGVRSVRGHHLRQGGHRPAPAVTRRCDSARSSRPRRPAQAGGVATPMELMSA